jgi:phage-related protein
MRPQVPLRRLFAGPRPLSKRLSLLHDTIPHEKPKTLLLLYQEADGTCPVDDWLQELKESDVKAYVDCRAKIERLAQEGHELRRPTADLLQDGIHELRAKRGHVNYRILYFFHGRNVVVLAHCLMKEREIPAADLERALHRKKAFRANPTKHTHQKDLTP